ncbi:MAG: hypothetical protein WD490_09725 [Opitutales bacterium]
MVIFFVCLLSPGLFSSAYSQPVRVWTDTGGRTVEAAIVQANGEEVQIRRAVDGRLFRWPRSRFSAQDQEYVLRWEAMAATSSPERLLSGGSQQHAVPERWPRTLRSNLRFSPEAVMEDPSLPRYVYRTPHFEFHSNARLTSALVREFGDVFEATHAAIQSLPLKLAPQPVNDYYRAYFFEDVEAFYRAGGVPDSSGAYVPATGRVLVPLEYLGTRRSLSGFSPGPSQDNTNLIHEVTHQMMHSWVGRGIPIWLFEGMAVYMQNVPYDRGTFHFDRMNIRVLLARNAMRGNEVSMTAVRDLMTMSEREWVDAFPAGSSEINYFSSFLLTYFFIHQDGRGDASRLFNYFRALERGEDPARAKNWLLGGRSYDQLTADIERSFQPKGYRIRPFRAPERSS